ncbi:putative Ig domain-containing protein [Pectobacterium cacticida]|uniref:putative Ig domain-containing protein n=1 Tax=Pectobacterium cacticida TaxID=69221 RepID=UPI002FF0ABDE
MTFSRSKAGSALARAPRQAWVLEPRMMFDAAAVATAAEVATHVAATDTAPGVDATPVKATLAITDTSDRFEPIDLFSDVRVSADKSGQELKDQLPKVGAEAGSVSYDDLLKQMDDAGNDQYAGIQGVTAIGNRVYAVRGNNTLMIFQHDENGALSLSESKPLSGITDASEVRASNDGKTLYVIGTDGAVLLDVENLQQIGSIDSNQNLIRDVLTHADNVYVSVGNSVQVYSHEGSTLTLEQTLEDAGETGVQLDGANALAISADGKTLYVATSGGDTLVSTFAIAADGQLSFNTAVTPNMSSEYGYYASSLSLAEDGKSLYVINEKNLHIFTIAADGSLSAGESIDLGDGADMVRSVITSPDGKNVAVIGKLGRSENFNTYGVFLYVRAEDGSLTLSQKVERVSNSENLSDTTFQELSHAAFSADGKQLYLTGTFNYGTSGLLVLDLVPATVNFSEKGEPAALLPGGVLASPDLDVMNDGAGDYNGASITIERNGGANADDIFTFIDSDKFKLDAESSTLLLDGKPIATFTSADGKLTLTFIATVTQANAQNVLRHIAYANSSKDPTKDGANVAFDLILSDGNSHSDAFVIHVGLEGVNDPPVIESTPLTPSYTAESERVKLFENTHIDTIERGQKLWQVIVTVDAVNKGDVLGAGGGKILLDSDNNSGKTGTGLEYRITKDAENGKTTVILYVTSMSVAEVETLIDGLTYGNTGNELTGTRSIGLGVKEAVEFDAKSIGDTTMLDAASVVTLTKAATENTAPNLSGGAMVDYTELGDPVIIAPGVTISDAQMDVFNGGAGNYDDAVLTITLGQGKSGADVLGFKADKGLELKDGALLKDGKAIGAVSLAEGVMTIRFSDGAGEIPTTEDVQNTLRQITYANTSHVPPESVALSITLADQRGLTSATLAQSIAIAAVNDVPSIGVDPVLSLGDLEHVQDITDIPGLGMPKASVASSDGSRIYIADAQGNIALFNQNADSGELNYVATYSAEDGADGIKNMVLSADGKNLYALHADGNALLCFNTDAEGVLTYQTTLVSDFNVDNSNLTNMQSMALSEDGKNLYVVNGYNVVYFARNTETGTLAYTGVLEGSMWDAPYLWQPMDIVSQGNLVYVVTNASDGSSLIVYQRDESGKLDLLGYTRMGDEALANLQHIAVSDDGSMIFVANSRTSTYIVWNDETIIHNHPQKVYAFSLDAQSGALTYLRTIKGEQTVEDIALSADGKALFVTLADGTLNYYAATTGELKGTLSGITDAGQISLTPDGGVIVAGEAINVSQAPQVSGPQISNNGEMVPVIPVTHIADVELDAAANGNGNYGGASIRIAGDADSRFGFISGNGYTLANNEIARDGNVLAQWAATSDGVLTVTFKDGVTTVQANETIRQIAYGWAGASVPQTNTIALTVTFNDGDLDSVAQHVSVAINAIPVSGTGEFIVPPLMVGISPDASSLQLPENLFTDPDGDTLSWRVDGLPKGMRFDAETRQIVGTPSEAGVFAIDVIVNDGKAESSRSFSLTVEANTPPTRNDAAAETVRLALEPTLRGGERFDYVLPQDLFTDSDIAKGDILHWQIEGLPAGLSFDPATLTISGTPIEEGTFTLTMTAQDSAQGSATLTVTLTVENEMTFVPIQRAVIPQEQDDRNDVQLRASDYDSSRAATDRAAHSTTQAVLDSLNEAERARSREWGIDPIMPSLMPELEPVNFSSRDRGTPVTEATSTLFQTVRGQATAIESSFSALQGSLLPDSTGALAFTLPQRLFTTRDGHVALTLQLANGNPLPSWVHFDSRHGVVRIVDAGALQVNQIQLSLKAQAADGSSRILPITLRVAPAVESVAPSVPLTQWREPAAADLPVSDRQDAMTELAHHDGKPAFSEQIEARHEHDELLNALAQLAGTAS